MPDSRYADWFVVWDTTIAGIQPLMDLLARAGANVPARAPIGGDLSIEVLERGIAAHGHIVVLTDRPNANVGYELGHALGDAAKRVALIFTAQDRPGWMQYPPLAGVLSHPVRDPQTVLNLPDDAFMRGNGRRLDGEDTLFLCPKGIEGATLAHEGYRLFPSWRVLPDEGWNISTLPLLLDGIGRVVWVITSHREGPDARDGSENARNGVVAGFAERCGAQLDVLISTSARGVVDVEARARRFGNLNEFQAALSGKPEQPSRAAAQPGPAQQSPPDVLDFSLFIARATQDFVGREWLAARVDEFLSEHERGYVHIQALPGMGKTAFAANLAHSRGWPHHFNARRIGVVSFEAFLRNVRAQLVVQHALDLRPPADQDLKHSLFLDRMLVEAGRQLTARGERAVVVVDGLDEAEPGPEGSQPLFLPTVLPSGIRMVVLGRQDSQPRLAAEQPLLPLTIDPADPENERDIRAFLDHSARGVLASLLAFHGKSASWFIDAMDQASQGNFMYVRSVVNDILRGSDVVTDLGKLPKGLEDYYERHWQRIERASGGDDWPSRLLFPTLCVLSVADAPITLDDIEAVLHVGFPHLRGTSAGAVMAALSRWGQFLVREPTPSGPAFQVYHKSFQEFLRSKPQVSSELARRDAMSWIATAVMRAHLGKGPDDA